MKTLLKASLLALGLGAGTFSILQAAAPEATTTPTERHPRLRALLRHRAAMRAQVARRLDLSPEQKTQLKAARSKTAGELKALRADPSLTREQKRAKARELIQSARTNFRDVLTPEQKAKIQEFRARRQAARANKV